MNKNKLRHTEFVYLGATNNIHSQQQLPYFLLGRKAEIGPSGVLRIFPIHIYIQERKTEHFLNGFRTIAIKGLSIKVSVFIELQIHSICSINKWNGGYVKR